MIELLGGEVVESMQGRSLIDFMTAGQALQDLPAYSETHYPRLHFGWSSLYSYSSGRYKFILSPNPELYNLESDPAELTNIYEQSNSEAERLREELEKCRTQFRSEWNLMEPDLDAADPKSRMEVYWQINDSIAASRAGQHQKALNTIRDVLQKDPQNPAAHFALGSLYLDQRQYLLAVQEFRSSFEQSPLSYENRINLSLAYLQAGLNGRAQELLKGILDENPADSVACQFLAISYAKQGKLQEAITLGRKAVELRPLSASAHYNLGSYYLRSGEMPEAEQTFEKVIELAPTHVEARANLSHVLLSQGLNEEALQQALELVKLAPDFALGHFYLGQAYEAKGLTAKAEAAFRKAKELDPRLTVPAVDL
jgi:tetratricopeptide (TPR) repeat protein